MDSDERRNRYANEMRAYCAGIDCLNDATLKELRDQLVQSIHDENSLSVIEQLAKHDPGHAMVIAMCAAATIDTELEVRARAKDHGGRQ